VIYSLAKLHKLGLLFSMSDDIKNTIEVLATKVRAKEDEANKLKHLVNELCVEADIPIRYPNVTKGGAVSELRTDHFYGQTLTAAIRNYLEHRKSSGLGAASAADIFRAIRDGGYKFDTKSEKIAQISVGNTLRKTSSIFHRLPNGQYGLLVWYPSAKALPEKEAPKKKHGKQNKKAVPTAAPTQSPPSPQPASSNGDQVTNEEIRQIILSQAGEFQAPDIEAAVKSKYPSKEFPKTKINAVIFIAKGKGLIREVSPRTGTRGAIYVKV
jgi:hypothetical protein